MARAVRMPKRMLGMKLERIRKPKPMPIVKVVKNIAWPTEAWARVMAFM